MVPVESWLISRKTLVTPGNHGLSRYVRNGELQNLVLQSHAP